MQSDILGAVPAQPIFLFVGKFGAACVLIALVLQVLSALLYLRVPQKPAWEKWARLSFSAGCVFFFGAFVSVIALFVNDQFEYKYVFSHGSKDTALKYKIAGAWSGQEGSILLWGTASALFGLISARATGVYRRWFTISYAAFLASVAGILAYESPFAMRPLIDGVAMVPQTGAGLSPSLLNYWVVIHPPTIFSGFGSLTVLFAWAIAALIQKDLTSWITAVRPWALVSLTLLGLGLAMGGFWAYETLGWGGFWMWDPVENTSFVPWVAVAAFTHGIFTQVSRKKWMFTNVMLAGLPFLLFCYGTFLTRSGFLGDASVHSFAEMNHSALWILVGVIVTGIVSFGALWFTRLFQMRGAESGSRPMKVLPINRESMLAIGVWLLVGFGVVTAIGMSVPFIQALMGQKPKVVEEPLYNTVLSFFFLPLVVVMAVSPFITWRGLGFRELTTRFLNVFALSVGLVGCTLLWLKSDYMGIPADPNAKAKLFLFLDVDKTTWMMVLSFFCYFGIIAALWRLYEGVRREKSTIGGSLAHLGVTVALFGLIFSRGMEQKQEAFVIPPGRPTKALGYEFTVLGATSNFVDPNNHIQVAVKGPSHPLKLLGLQIPAPNNSYKMDPGLYFNGMDQDGNPLPMIWPGIHGSGLYDMYLVLHNMTFDATGPTPMQKGDMKILHEESMLVTYNGMRTEGQLGQAGAKFFASVKIQTPEGVWNLEPGIQLTDGGMQDMPAKIGDKYSISLVSMDAANKGATIQVHYLQPAYVAELFYKPLTLFVWLGVGIMTLGGGLTALTRRVRNKTTVTDEEAEADGTVATPPKRHAPEPLAQS